MWAKQFLSEKDVAGLEDGGADEADQTTDPQPESEAETEADYTHFSKTEFDPENDDHLLFVDSQID